MPEAAPTPAPAPAPSGLDDLFGNPPAKADSAPAPSETAPAPALPDWMICLGIHRQVQRRCQLRRVQTHPINQLARMICSEQAPRQRLQPNLLHRLHLHRPQDWMICLDHLPKPLQLQRPSGLRCSRVSSKDKGLDDLFNMKESPASESDYPPVAEPAKPLAGDKGSTPDFDKLFGTRAALIPNEGLIQNRRTSLRLLRRVIPRKNNDNFDDLFKTSQTPNQPSFAAPNFGHGLITLAIIRSKVAWS